MPRKRLDVFYSKNIGSARIAMQAIDQVYREILEAKLAGLLEIDRNFLSRDRNQYDADLLLSNLKNHRNLFLWIVHVDIFSDNLNFVFGCAIPFKGAILSTYRLDSRDLIEKEVIHEIGHVLGLSHCKNNCVMMFSNSLYDAILKPKNLCDMCREKLREIYGYV